MCRGKERMKKNVDYNLSRKTHAPQGTSCRKLLAVAVCAGREVILA